MRKLAFVAAALALGSTANAQLTQLFKLEDTTSALTWLNAGDQTRGMAYNPVTGNIIVVDRDSTSGNRPYSINGTSGAQIGAFDNTGITGGTFPVNKPLVDTDGRVYVTNGATTAFKVYRWADEASGPSSAATTVYGPVTLAHRVGDDAAITGGGANVKIITSGNGGTTSVYVLTDPENDGTFTQIQITMPAAITGIPQVDFDPDDDTKFWIREIPVTPAAKQFNVAAGAAVAGGAADITAVLPTNGASIDVAKVGSLRLYALGPGAVAATTPGVVAQVFRTDETVARHSTGDINRTGGAVANGNAAGDIALASNGNLYVLYTNNSLSGWSGVNSVEDWNLL